MAKPETVRIWLEAAGRLDDMAKGREMQASDAALHDGWRSGDLRREAKVLRDAAAEFRRDAALEPSPSTPVT